MSMMKVLTANQTAALQAINTTASSPPSTAPQVTPPAKPTGHAASPYVTRASKNAKTSTPPTTLHAGDSMQIDAPDE